MCRLRHHQATGRHHDRDKVGRRGSDASVYHVELANIGTLESNSPVMIDGVVVGSVGKMTSRGWIVDLALM